MKPTKEQLADPKWWDENADPLHKYCYMDKTDGQWFTAYHFDNGVDGFELLAKRPQPNVSDTDWLKKGVNVTTPKGVAEVRSITEDDGVYTTLGNFCRSELSEVKSEWVPKVGVECLWFSPNANCWTHTKVIAYNDSMTSAWLEGEGVVAVNSSYSQFRPIKTQREEFIEEAKSRIKNMDADDIILAGKLYDAGCRFDLTEKDGE